MPVAEYGPQADMQIVRQPENHTQQLALFYNKRPTKARHFN